MENSAFPVPELAEEPSRSGDERHTVVTFLDFFRSVLLRKGAGLSHTELHTALPMSTLTIGGLLRHMTFVEEYWFRFVLLGEEYSEPWASAPWQEQPDWEFDTAPDCSPVELATQFEAAVDRSRSALAARPGLDTVAARQSWGQDTTVRWILVHMIEEYARHCGHADLIRQSLDGATGD
jgi:uncharacterized damage-inducible protein DinB